MKRVLSSDSFFYFWSMKKMDKSEFNIPDVPPMKGCDQYVLSKRNKTLSIWIPKEASIKKVREILKPYLDKKFKLVRFPNTFTF